MIRSKELKEFHMKDKLLNMMRLFIMKEFQLKELSQITMLLKLKLNIFQSKFKKLLLNINQFKKHGKEFNIFQLKLKLFTTQKEKSMSKDKDNIFRLVMLKEEANNRYLQLIKLHQSLLNHLMLQEQPQTMFLEEEITSVEEITLVEEAELEEQHHM